MGKLFRNKYHIGSCGYRSYDYSLPGRYFATICAKNKSHYFGEIVNEEMRFSKIGEIVRDEWLKIAGIRIDMNVNIYNHYLLR